MAEATRGGIAFVVPRYGPQVLGGAEALCRAVAEDLAAHGERVEVFTTCALDHFTWDNALAPGTTRMNDVTVRRFPVSAARDQARFEELHHGINRGDPVDALAELEWMAHSVCSEELDHALAGRDDLRCRIAMPYLFGTTFWTAAADPSATVLVPCLHDEAHAHTDTVRRMLTSVAGCIANAPAERALIERLAPAARTALGGFGFDEPAGPADPAGFCHARGISPGYLLYAGRREEAKGLPTLFRHYGRYAQEHPDVPPLALMGSGDLPVPEDLAARVIDLGLVPEAHKHHAMGAAGVFVHPSRMESFGAVLAESWLQGVPALVDGRSPVLRDHCAASGGGLWYDDYPEFAEALTMLLEDDDLRARLGAAGRDYIREEYSWGRVRARYLAALDEWL